jgi:serine/threonine protein kinase
LLAAEEFISACGGCADFSDEAFTAERLKACIDLASMYVQPWKPGQFIQTLHKNPHTRTTVDIMSFPGPKPNKVVVKRMPNDWVETSQEEFEKLHPHEREQPWHDLGILRHLNEIGYPFVCKLLCVFRDEENTYVTSARASEGDMHTWCRKLARPGSTRESQLQPVAIQIFSAVRWLHELGIAHRDLSLENVLLHRCHGSGGANCEVHVRLCDFAMCSLERSCTDGVRGKRSYQAPEMHSVDKAYDPFLADAFALGVLLYAAAAQDYPWNSTLPEASCDQFRYAQSEGFRKFLEVKRLRKTGPTMVHVFSEPLVALLEGLMHVEPKKRLTLGESCFVQPPREVKQPQAIGESVGINEAVETPTTQVTSVWATRWLNEAQRAGCFGC